MVVPTSDRPSGLWVPGLDAEHNEPSLSEVLKLYSDSRAYFRPFHQQCAEEEEYYFLRRPIPSPPGMTPIRPATAFAIINVATDHVDVNNIEIDVPSAPRSRARAERLKKFYQGAWLNIKGPVKRTAVRHSFAYGIGFMKPMFNSDLWPNAPIRESYGVALEDGGFMMIDEDGYKKALKDHLDQQCVRFPLVVHNVNPKNLIWDDSRTRRKWVIEFYDRNVRDIKRRYPEWMTVKDSNDITTWIEYWDEEWCGYIADNQWVWGPYRHGYGYLPYVSVEPANALDWDSGPPHLRYRGILRPVHSLLDAEARLVTQFESILRQYGWRTLDFSGPRQAADDARQQYEIYGGMNLLPPLVTVSESPKVTPPQELLQQLNLVQTLIEEATFPNVIRGLRPKGVSAGYAISALAGMGRLVFQGVADGMSRAIEQINSMFAMLVENKLKGPLTVFARSDIHNFDQTIRPDDIKGLYENRVAMKAEAPEERERESLLAMRQYQGGIISLYEAQRRSGIVNPLEEQLQQRAEQLLQSPEILAEQGRLAAEGMGLIQQFSEIARGQPGQGTNVGNEFTGLSSAPRLGEGEIQKRRVATNDENARQGAYPKGLGGLAALGKRLGSPFGGTERMPSGEEVP